MIDTPRVPLHDLRSVAIVIDGVNPDGSYKELGYRTYGEVAREVCLRLEAAGYMPDEQIGLWPDEWQMRRRDTPIKPYRWVCSYVVTGGSEGYYYHVEFIRAKKDAPPTEWGYEHEMFLLGKSLGATWDEAWLTAAAIAKLLGA